ADKLTPKMCERVKAFAGQLPLTRELVTLRRDVPFEFDLKACALDRLDLSAVRPIFEELGFTRLTQVLDEFAHDYPTRAAGGMKSRLVGSPRGHSRPGPDESGGKPAAQMPTASAERSQYELVDTSAGLDAFVSKLYGQRRFAFDTETTGLNPVHAELVGLSFCWQAGQAYYLPVRAAMGSVLPVERVVEKLRPIFEDPSIAKVGQNLKYDVLVLRQVGIVVAGVAFDTMLASFLLDPARQSHSLDALVQALIGHEMIPITALIGKG
ncbi:unnamed protein product, partial [marine sediment metagenome]